MIPQFLSDTLEQVYIEARSKAVKEQIETPKSLTQKVKVGDEIISNICPIQVLMTFNPKIIKSCCEEPADKVRLSFSRHCFRDESANG
ncbi:MAG: hypothetical protein ACK5NT_15205 [Pyrinomonadaceae bacterium]